MGGGDLNLKKSWHPQTAKNQEKVWKAEQIDAAEKRKLAELQKEINEERNREELKKIGQSSGVLKTQNDKKLEWMYKGSQELVNREDYLLGRTVDKTYEQLDEIEKQQQSGSSKNVKNHVEHECIPFSIRQFKGTVQSTDQVDLARKIMEDPVMAIKQKEMDTRRKILENPVKLKELHRLLKQEKSRDSSRKSKKKSSKKSKKSKRRSSSSNDSEENLDTILAKKIQGAINDDDDDEDDKNLDINKILSMKYEKLSKELDKIGKKHKKKKNKRQSDDDNSEREVSNRRHDFNERNNRKRSRSPQRYEHHQRKDYDYQRGRHFPEAHRNRTPYRSTQRQQSRSPVNRRQQSRSPVNRRQSPKRPRQKSPERRNRESLSPKRDISHDRRYKNPSPPPSKKQPRSRSMSSSSSRSSSVDSNKPTVRKFGLVTADGKQLKVKKLSHLEKEEFKKSTTSLTKLQPPPSSWRNDRKKEKLSEEEKERKRAEMLSNAQWRDNERQKNVSRYREEDKLENENHRKDFDRDFLTKQLTKAAKSETVESRIKSKVNSIQRSGQTMNSNFARR